MKRAAIILTILSLLCAAALLVGLLRPTSLSIGHLALGVDGRFLEFGMGSDAITKKLGIWKMPPGAAFVLGATSEWRPTMSDANIMVNGPGNVGITRAIRVVHVPLIPWVALLGGAAGLLWWRLPRVYPRGHCAGCGYDLSGSPGGKCPECGVAAFRMLAKLIRACRVAHVHDCL